MTSCTGCRCRRQGCTTKCGCGLRRAICNNCSLGSTQEGFAVYLTADHGNVTATGIGNPREGVLVETKGKRVRVYDRTEFLEEVANKFPDRFAGRTTACPRHVTFCWRAISRHSRMPATKLCPTVGSPWKKSWFRLWRSPGRGHEEGRRHFDQKIKRAWLDAVLDRLVQTTDEAELRAFLDKHLKDELPGKESRAKSAGIVLRIWSGIPPERVALRDRAVALLPRISGQERIWLHWGMTALAYPFFRDTAEVVGRLLALQDDFTTAQVQGRMLTTWGDRATSKEAAQKLITTLVDWEVLRSTKTKGHFLLARKMTASIPDLQLWLLEALLAASAADEIEAQQLLRLPESFPFTISVGVADLRRYEGFNIHRQGLDMDMVALRKVKVEPPPKPAKKPKKEKPAKTDHGSLFDMQAEESVLNNGKHDPVPVVPPPAPTESEPA